MAASRNLPPLRGRLLFGYRLAWALLAAGAVATLASLALSPTTDWPILALRLGKGAVLLAVSWILLRRRTDDGVAALLSLAFVLWTVTSSFDLATGNLPMAVVLADRLRFLLFALALLLFPTGAWSPGWTRYVAGASFVVFILGIAEGLGWAPSRLFLPLAILCVLASVGAVLERYRRISTPAERQQVKWIALGLVVGITLILGARAAAAPDRPALAPLAIEMIFQLGIVAIALGFLVSLLRYRLYDAEEVISRSAAYALLTLSLVATFAGSEALIEMLGQRYFGAGIGNISAAMAAAVAAVLLAPLHGRITNWAERRFQRDLVDLKEQLPELLAELSAISSPARIGQAALPRIVSALHADRSLLIIDGRVVGRIGIDARSAARWTKDGLPLDYARPFDHDRASEFPLRMPLRCPFGSLRGWLLLGPRPDSSPYSRDDLETLEAIGRPLRTALFAAREREREKKQEVAAQRSTLRKLDDLSRRIAMLETDRQSQNTGWHQRSRHASSTSHR
jgi:hypothetical protein